MHGWFVCPTVSMVTTSHATGLEKTVLGILILGHIEEGDAKSFHSLKGSIQGLGREHIRRHVRSSKIVWHRYIKLEIYTNHTIII